MLLCCWEEFRCQGRACGVGCRKGSRGERDGIGEGKRSTTRTSPWARRGERHRRRASHSASRLLFGAAMEAKGRKGEDEKGRRGPCATLGKAMVLVWGGGREQRAGGRADHGKQQQQTRSHVRAAGVGEGGWAGPGGREAEAQCASPGPPPTPAAAGRRGCGVNSQPNHS